MYRFLSSLPWWVFFRIPQWDWPSVVHCSNGPDHESLTGFLLFPASLPLPLPVRPWIIFQINYMLWDPCLRVCFWATQNKVTHSPISRSLKSPMAFHSHLLALLFILKKQQQSGNKNFSRHSQRNSKSQQIYENMLSFTGDKGNTHFKKLTDYFMNTRLGVWGSNNNKCCRGGGEKQEVSGWDHWYSYTLENNLATSSKGGDVHALQP